MSILQHDADADFAPPPPPALVSTLIDIIPWQAFVDVSNLFSGVDDGLGGIMDSVMEMNNEMFENFQLGVGDEDLQKLITGIFSDMAGWFDAMFDDFDIDAIKGVVDEAIAEASDGIQGFGNVFESVFEDVTEIPEQYAFFLKDKAIDVAEIAKEVFSADAIQGIPDDVAAMFENAGDDIEDAFGMMLEVPSMVVALGKAGVDGKWGGRSACMRMLYLSPAIHQQPVYVPARLRILALHGSRALYQRAANATPLRI